LCIFFFTVFSLLKCIFKKEKVSSDTEFKREALISSLVTRIGCTTEVIFLVNRVLSKKIVLLLSNLTKSYLYLNKKENMVESMARLLTSNLFLLKKNFLLKKYLNAEEKFLLEEVAHIFLVKKIEV
jgi:hypothetical protein